MTRRCRLRPDPVCRAPAGDALRSWFVGAAVVAALAFGPGALARTVNNCDIHTGTLCGEAELSGAKLAGSELALSNFMRADLSQADLSQADLHSANFRSANLRGANLRDAMMVDIDLERADLRNADLRGARIDASTELGRANVAGCIGCPPRTGAAR